MGVNVIPTKDEAGNVVQTSSPFASKATKEGKLYRRKHGLKGTCPPNSATEINIPCPYDIALIDEIEVVNCEAGDTIDMMVLSPSDPTRAAELAMPANTMLNQFGFDVNVSDIYYTDTSNYDAKLYKDMVVKLVYKNNGLNTKQVGINFVLHEVKTP